MGMIKMIWDPIEDIKRMHSEMDGLFGGVLGSHRLVPHCTSKELLKHGNLRMPLADIMETENNVIATFEIPGATKEDIDLNITDKNVEVKAEKKSEKEVKGEAKYAYQAKSHQFYRSLPLPTEVNADEAKANYKDGILRVEIPKVKEEAKKKKIEIN